MACCALSQLRSVQMLFSPTFMATQQPIPTTTSRALTADSLATDKRGRYGRPPDCLRSVRQSSQFVLQEFARPTVGKVSRGGVVVFSVMAGECVTLPRVAVHRRIWFLSECRSNRRLCSLGNELILLGQMHENGRMKPIDLSQVFLGIGAVIPDRGVDARHCARLS